MEKKKSKDIHLWMEKWPIYLWYYAIGGRKDQPEECLIEIHHWLCIHYNIERAHPKTQFIHFKCSSYNLVFHSNVKSIQQMQDFHQNAKGKYLDFYATSTQTKEMQDFNQKCKMLNIWFLKKKCKIFIKNAKG